MSDYVKNAKVWRDVGRIILTDLCPFLLGVITGLVLSPLLPYFIDMLRRKLFTIPWV